MPSKIPLHSPITSLQWIYQNATQKIPKGNRSRQEGMADPLPSSPAAPYGLGRRGLQKSNNIFGARPDLTEPSVKTQLARVGVVGVHCGYRLRVKAQCQKVEE